MSNMPISGSQPPLPPTAPTPPEAGSNMPTNTANVLLQILQAIADGLAGQVTLLRELVGVKNAAAGILAFLTNTKEQLENNKSIAQFYNGFKWLSNPAVVAELKKEGLIPANLNIKQLLDQPNMKAIFAGLKNVLALEKEGKTSEAKAAYIKLLDDNLGPLQKDPNIKDMIATATTVQTFVSGFAEGTEVSLIRHLLGVQQSIASTTTGILSQLNTILSKITYRGAS